MTGEQNDDRCPEEELAVGYAMHALEPGEEALVRAHVLGCGRCQESVRATQEVTAALGGSVRQYDPPERLRTRLMDAIEHTPQVQVDEPVPLGSRRRDRPGGWGRKLLLAAAALVVVAGIGVAGVRFGQLNERVAEQDVRAGQMERALRIAADPDATRAVLQDESGDAVAVLLSADDAAAIVPTDLPSNDVTRQIYVVWGTGTPEPVALATFDVTASDADVRLLAWSPDAHGHKGFGISLEEGRTAPARPSSVLASGQVGPA
ncbi:anti-sigma factor domain-containing protein [Saccharothrix luteola]|uniref:anti-sigma factor n=1 Tax=Saccharothrix luteola TaxID=2893018 RepID=UPI001E46EBEE|nr:anti-sigma factor [Saccharothrix luteola]MCC8251609.1 anti-sigma factor [Saccharothrix luteola]